MIITVIIDNEVVVEKTGKEIGIKLIKKLLKTGLLSIAFNNIPTIAMACTPYNSPTYLKSQLVLFMLERLKADELQEALKWWSDLPVEGYKLLKELYK